MGKEFDTTTPAADSIDILKKYPELDTPEFRANHARANAERLAQQQRDDQTLQAYRNRPKPKFSDLPFVGKKYRSQNRRSADKMTAWAVKPELGATAAMQGFEYARQFMHHINARAHDDTQPGSKPWAGHGVTLENIIIGMADTLATCKPADKDAHLSVIRGFCSVLELAAIQALDSFNQDEHFNAATYQIRMAHLDENKRHVCSSNARSLACRLEKHRMLEAANAQ